jgi:malate dehydrogenase (oxaloacetate-decarboxylating)
VATAPSASYSLAIRIKVPTMPGMLAISANAIGKAGGEIGDITLISEDRDFTVRDFNVNCSGLQHQKDVVGELRKLGNIEIVSIIDRTYNMHLGGKITTESKYPLKTRDDLSMAYTPGVARVCMAIHDDPMRAHNLTIKKNTVAVISDGTAVLGLGDIGPEAAMPVMEGKAVLFKEFGGVDSFPVCINTKDPEEIIAFVKAIAPTFGGINLEDISAPRCFEIEERLKAELDIPVFHDDQHGTAVVALAALINALKIVNKPLESLKVIVSGVGAAGVACSKILLNAGVKNIIGLDRNGAIHKGRTDLNSIKQWYAENTNPECLSGKLNDVIEGADLFLGVSGPGTLKVEDVKKMGPDAMVFAMANPIPEIMPEEAAPYVRIMATGRSDYANQINNVLAFPGIFRGALDCRASAITENMKLAAAQAIADMVTPEELSEAYIIPSVFDNRVGPAVAKAVCAAAIADGVARLTGGEVPTFDELTR